MRPEEIPQFPQYQEKLAINDQLFSPQTGVKLKAGLFRQVFDYNRAFLKTLDKEAMKYWYCRKANIPTSAQPYRGHFEDNLKGLHPIDVFNGGRQRPSLGGRPRAPPGSGGAIPAV